MFKTLKWEDWLGIALGALLLVSPWIFGYSDSSAATMNALVMGSILVLEEFLEVGEHETVEEWIDVVAGLWLMAAPSVLGFSSEGAAALTSFAVGAFTVLFAALAMTSFDEKIGHWWHEHVTGA